MPCGYGLPDPEDCAISHWSPAVDGRRGGSGWRAPCPVKGCPADDPRLLQYEVYGKGVRFRHFCPHHNREAVKAALHALLGPCGPGRNGKQQALKPDDLAEVALSAITSAMSLKLVLLEMSGLSTSDALTKLGIRRENRPRVIAGARVFKSDT